MKAIINGQIFHKGRFIKDHVIMYSDKIDSIISKITYEQLRHLVDHELDGEGAYVVPGFIDVHIHGYKGADAMDGELDSLNIIKKALPENGITSFLATTMTMPESVIIKALKVIRTSMEYQKKVNHGARILGAHLEGPFINEAYKGAQVAEYITNPNELIIEAFKDIIKIVTIAPEVQGAIDMINKYHDIINFSLGHTNATYEEAKVAFQTGAKSTTHLFNAMTGLHHRDPGVVGAALTSDCYSEVIADKFHIHESLFQLLVKAKGLNRLMLVTDCMRAGGLDEGEYDLGGQIVTVQDGKCLLKSGIIAGSVLRLNQGVKNFVESVQETLEEVLPLVTINQAKYLHLENEIGTLDEGKWADIVLLSNNLDVKKTIVKGNVEYDNDK